MSWTDNNCNEHATCPECNADMEYVEGVFMNEIGESEYRGYKCKECGYHTEEG